MGHTAVWGTRGSDGASALESGKAGFKFRKIQKRRTAMNRNSRILVGLICTALLVFAAETRAGNNGAEAFEKIKSLAGHWEGSAPGDAKLTADIEVTSGGNAVLERFRTIESGKPMTMITIYYLDGDTLKLTHYCHAGNQPTMAATYDAAAGVITFDFVGATNLKADDLHMHHAVFTLVDANHLKETWTMYKEQKNVGAETMSLTRGK
jgi:hypothetical protein